MTTWLRARDSIEPNQDDAIGSALELLKASLSAGLVLLASTRSRERIIVADSCPERDLIGKELNVPSGLLSKAPTLLPTGAMRIPLAWTVACAERPSYFASAPIPGHQFHLVAAGFGEAPSLEGISGVASIVAGLLDAGQQTRAQTHTSRKIHSLVRHLPVPLVFVDSEALQVFINDRARALLCLNDDDNRSPSIAAALARLINVDGTGEIQRDLNRNPDATLTFEIKRADRDFKVESHWIDDDGLSGRIWLFADITEEKILRAKLARLASVDVLTGVLNRRSFDGHVTSEIYRALRHGSPLSLLMLDLDHFKRINDTHGHQAGDKVLQETSRIAASSLRESDILARTGGEEFAILLPRTPLKGALDVAERLCAFMRAAEVQHGGARLKVTCSIGIAEFEGQLDTAELMIARGDAALYSAKRLGRDRVAVAMGNSFEASTTTLSRNSVGEESLGDSTSCNDIVPMNDVAGPTPDTQERTNPVGHDFRLPA